MLESFSVRKRTMNVVLRHILAGFCRCKEIAPSFWFAEYLPLIMAHELGCATTKGLCDCSDKIRTIWASRV